jgi:hypothetical protein
VLVTSYETGETGPYVLTIDPAAGSLGTPTTRRDVTTLTVRNSAVDRGRVSASYALFER